MYENFVLYESDSGKLEGYLWDVRDPDKVICIIHGIGEYGGRFDRVAAAFCENNMAAVAFDLRGHGNSMGKKGHCAPRSGVLDDVSRLVTYALKKYPGKPIVLYGHSMGGNIVLDYRSRGKLNGKLSGYVVTAPWIRLVRPVPTLLYRIVKAISKIFPSFTIGSEVNEKDLGHPESVKPYKDNPMIHNKISALCAAEGFETGLALEEGSLEDNGNAAKIPLLLMHGDQDRICSVEGSRRIAERLKREGADIEYKEWKGLYHEIHNGGAESKGDEVIDTVIKWLKTLK